LPAAAPVNEAVMFAFDDRAFPFCTNIDLHLIPGNNPEFVLPAGPAGSHDRSPSLLRDHHPHRRYLPYVVQRQRRTASEHDRL
jgi:hypothetical protein